MKRLKKGANFSDIHFGRKNNAETHNQDCLDFIVWLVDKVRADPTIDHINFLGDWNEHRNSINGLTLDYSYRAAKLLDSLGIPVFFIVGNHDLYFRNNRNIFTTIPFESLNNFRIISELTVVEEMGDKGAIYSPFLFESEFPTLLNYIEYPVVWGHLEFAGFVVTGDTIIKEHGPDHLLYKSFKRIFTGHYHKRQRKGNISYIGSTHPMDYSDAGDIARGMCVYDYDTDTETYIDWKDCPTYTHCNLSDIIASPDSVLKAKGTVKAYIDVDLGHAQAIELKEKLIKTYSLRELVFEENKTQSLDGDTATEEELQLESIDALIKHKLKSVNVEGIDPDLLVKHYESL